MKKAYTSLQHRPFLTPVWLSALAAIVVLALAAWLWDRASSTTVIVIRHAEKEIGSIEDPPLTPEGTARALLLARMFGERGGPGRLDAIYVSPTRRSQLTAAPLIARTGLNAKVVDERDTKELAARLLRENRGGRVLVVGHSDTIPSLVAYLSGRRDIAPMGAAEYGTLYIISVPLIGHPNLLRLTY